MHSVEYIECLVSTQQTAQGELYFKVRRAICQRMRGDIDEVVEFIISDF